MANGGHIRQAEERQFNMPTVMKPHIEKVLAGEYSVPWDKDKPCLVLDIGANCGAFAIWAKLSWPMAEIDCYEPNPDMVKYLRENLAGLDRISIYESAVGDSDRDKLYLGKHNPGECSQYLGNEQLDDAIEIDVVEPDNLLSYDIVKLDCEGAESYILARLDLSQTKFVMFEYHSENDRRFCDEIMWHHAFTLIELKVTSQGYGVAKYQRF
jgi:FkbM family methyltransferase